MSSRRYKGAYGGRGGAKSHFFAEQAILRAYTRRSRIVCIREVQNSIKDSVKQLLVDKIQKFGLGPEFEVVDTEIRGPRGSLIIFKGMQSYNADNIKSLEAYDIAWVEEAQNLSQRSLDLLRPTIRKDGSELWFSWNPRYKTDPVDVFFRKNPPPDAISVLINWRDNPWFPDVLRKEMEHDFAIDADKAEHVWNGAYGSGQGAILARWVHKAEREGRIHTGVAYDPDGPPIEISSDLGFRDTASWWLWQRRQKGFVLLGYDGDSGLDADDWAPRLKEQIGVRQLGKIWLPHDARAKTFQSKYSSIERFVEAFGADKVAVVPQSRKADQISAAREIIDRCEFHKEACEDGLDGLSAWEFDYNDELGVFSREPLHNWACMVGDTLVESERGPSRIDDIRVGDRVMTPAGWRAVTATHVYECPKIVVVTALDGREIQCTPEHKLFTARGLVRADALHYNDVLFSGKERIWPVISWISTAAGITGIHQAITDSLPPKSSAERASRTGRFIGMFGRRLMGTFQTAAKYITPMETGLITTCQTSSALIAQNIRYCMGQKAADGLRHGTSQTPEKNSTLRRQKSSGNVAERNSSSDYLELSPSREMPQNSGTPARKGGRGTKSTASERGRLGQLGKRIARFAVRALLRVGRIRANTAGQIVALRHLEGAPQRVYDLTVERDHCYFANGILSSNSHPSDAFAYGCQVMKEAPAAEKPETIEEWKARVTRKPTLNELWETNETRRQRI